MNSSQAITGTTLDLSANGLAWGDVNKAGSTLNDLAILSTSKALTGTSGFFSGAGTIGGALIVTGTAIFGNLMEVNANADFDSISVGGVSDLTSIKNSGVNPITISDNLIVTGTLTAQGIAEITGPMTVTNEIRGTGGFLGAVTGGVTATTLSIGGVQQTGAIKYGFAAGAISNGSTIAHGLAVTPTFAMLTAGASITTPLWITSLNATNIVVGINDGISVTGVYWAVGP